ncbi:MAG: CxxxxCH/CxxCH domain-containing protein [Deltaproteobacteria bacterium]|nr:CxxxxCH/CxxCH domain-containing protein [Deltaproteobacteria bacterium]
MGHKGPATRVAAIVLFAVWSGGCGGGSAGGDDVDLDDAAGEVDAGDGSGDSDAGEDLSDGEGEGESGGDGSGDGSDSDGGGDDGDGGTLPCGTCHGDSTSAAPPLSLADETVTTARGVGAHRSHLGSSDWHREVRCDDCHIVPAELLSPGHIDTDLPAELTWSSIAVADGAVPAFDGLRCANAYCHGATLLPGGSNTAPAWTTVDGTQAACGTCHGLPAGGGHPALVRCEQCHSAVMGPGMTFAAPELHIDGIVEADALDCESCHGGGGSAAPPVDTSGGTATTLRGVGAHRSHLQASDWRADIACTECHQVPATLAAPGHLDTPLPAELLWGGVATADGATPVFDGTVCSSTYCHGPTLLAGGSLTAPSWATVDGSQAACGTCHGLPPEGTHPSDTRCELCHGEVIGAGMRFVDRTRHVNGVVDVSYGDCESCHGGGGSAAPPRDATGGSGTSLRGVGAHRSHQGASSWYAEIACSQCHRVPATVPDVGHIDTPLPAELTWGPLPVADGAAPAFDGASCAGNYCHGATLLPGGTITVPAWTTVDGTQAACGTCHGLPPGGTHPSDTRCELCHGDVIGAGRTFVDASRHVNGIVDVDYGGCESCHGGGGSAAPPQDTTGGTATTSPGVGAHRSHLGPSTWHAEIRCSECHRVPTSVSDPGHLDGSLPADLAWGALTTADGAAPAFDGTRCAGTYCHGATLDPGGTITQPVWTAVDGTQDACGTCHGLPPGGPHPTDGRCELCHATVIAAGGAFVAPALHVDGLVEVTAYHPAGWDVPAQHGAAFDTGPAACTSCHGSDLRGGAVGVSCESCHAGFRADCTFCHGGLVDPTGAPPEDVAGATATTVRGVGAHSTHVAGGSTWRADLDCSDCHVVPADALSPGHIDPRPGDLTWGGLSVADGAVPAFDGARCTSTYCHGATLGAGGTTTTPQWMIVDGTQDACGTCHGVPPPAPHASRTDCGTCHGAVYDGTRFVDRTRHIDGVLDVSGGCDACHGNPPTAVTQDYAGGGGAHAAHVTTLGYTCAICHGHEGSGPTHNEGGGIVRQANVDIAFAGSVSYPAGTTMNNGGTPAESYGAGNPTCTVGCHNPVPGDSADLANPATWTDTTIACSECHERPGLVPRVSHRTGGTDAVVRANCSECHDSAAHLSGTRPIGDPDGTDTYSFAGTGLSGLCRTCHDGSSGPYFTGQTPMSVAYYWTLPSSHGAASYDCATCHDRHGSSSGTALFDSEEPPCLTCHDGAPAATNIQGQLAKAFQHPVSRTGRHDLFEAGTAAAYGATPTDNRHAECVDCHDPHYARGGYTPGTTSSNRLLGVGRIRVTNGAAGTVPAYTYVPSSDPTGTPLAEYQVCFKCHSSWTAQPAGAADLALLFNPANESFHPVEGAGRNTSATMTASLAGGTGLPHLTTTSTVWCSDCHASSDMPRTVSLLSGYTGAIPTGPHGSDAGATDVNFSSKVLRANYRVEQLSSTAAFASSNFEFCFICHSSAPFATTGTGARTDTAFRFHGFHMGNIDGNPRGGVAGDIDVRNAGRAGQGNAVCKECHYNIHGNRSSGWASDRTYQRLVNFAPSVSGPAGDAADPTWNRTGRSCTLRCHNFSHNPENY